MKYYVYMLRCNDCSFYTGFTTNIERRLEEHRSGNGSRYTRSRLPVRLVYLEEHASMSDALKREDEIKRFSKREKMELIKSQGYQQLYDMITM